MAFREAAPAPTTEPSPARPAGAAWGRHRRWGLALLRVLVALSLVSSAGRAGAQETPEEGCIRAAEGGQRLRKDGKLMDAHASFSACAKLECPEEVAARCTEWLAQVDRAMPSLVVSAQDASGKDLLDASVTVDGRAMTEPLAGRALAVDPGTHVLELAANNGARATETVILHEGEKDRMVVLRLPSPARPNRPAQRTVASRPVPWTVWTAGALGVVATGVLVGFGSAGLVDRDRFACARGCAPGKAAQVDAEFVVADVGLVAALASFAAAGVLWILRPTVLRTLPVLAARPIGRAPALGGW